MARLVARSFALVSLLLFLVSAASGQPLPDPNDLIRAGRYADAADLLSTHLTEQPLDYDARYKLILLRLKTDRPLDAAAELQILKAQAAPVAARYVKELEPLIPAVVADPARELALREKMRVALEAYRVNEAMDAIQQMQIPANSREILRFYIDIYQAKFASALGRALKIAQGRSSDDINVAMQLQGELAKSNKEFLDLTHELEEYLYSPLAVGSCTPLLARNTMTATASSLQEYLRLVSNGNRLFPLNPHMLDLKFHAVLISYPYEDVKKIGDEILAAKGHIKIPFYSADALFYLVIDDKSQRLYTEIVRSNDSGDTTGLERLTPIDASFGSIHVLGQRVGTDTASQGLVNRSYVLQLEPRGTAPNYTFMGLLQCLYGEKTQKTVSRNLAQYIVDRLDNPSLKAHIADPNKNTVDWLRATSQLVAASTIMVAQVAGLGRSDETEYYRLIVQQQTIDSAFNLAQVNVEDMIRVSQVIGKDSDRTSLYTNLKAKAFPLIDTATSKEYMKNVNDLLAALPQ